VLDQLHDPRGVQGTKRGLFSAAAGPSGRMKIRPRPSGARPSTTRSTEVPQATELHEEAMDTTVAVQGPDALEEG